MPLFLLSFISVSLFAQTPALKLNRTVTNAGNTCCGFRAQNSSELPMSLSATKENTIVFDKEVFDDANAFNGAAYKAPSDGVYHFSAQFGIKAVNTSSSVSQLLVKIKTTAQSSQQLINIPAGNTADNIITAETNVILKLKAGEEVSVVVIGLGTAAAATTGNLNYFSGYKIY